MDNGKKAKNIHVSDWEGIMFDDCRKSQNFDSLKASIKALFTSSKVLGKLSHFHIFCTTIGMLELQFVKSSVASCRYSGIIGYSLELLSSLISIKLSWIYSICLSSSVPLVLPHIFNWSLQGC